MADGGFFQHETAIVESPSIGAGTRIWAFAHVLPGAVIGAACNICDQTFIENDVRIGDRGPPVDTLQALPQEARVG